MESAFVTGIAGFLGSRIAASLIADGITVYGCDNYLTGNSHNVPKEAIVINQDIRYMCDGELKGDVIYHTAAIARSAWPNDAEVIDVNVNGTRRILSMLDGRPMVYSSSSVAAIPTINTYAFSKYLSEQEVIEAGHTALRYCNIYGPGQSLRGSEPNVLAAWKKQLNKQGYIEIHGDGNQERDFIHVDDVVRANKLVAESSTTNRWWDVCTGDSYSLLEIAIELDVPVKFTTPRRNDPMMIAQSMDSFKKYYGWWQNHVFWNELKEVFWGLT